VDDAAGVLELDGVDELDELDELFELDELPQAATTRAAMTASRPAAKRDWLDNTNSSPCAHMRTVASMAPLPFQQGMDSKLSDIDEAFYGSRDRRTEPFVCGATKYMPTSRYDC
jgi:hypothetical protein